MKCKFLSWLLTIALAISLLTVSASAASTSSRLSEALSTTISEEVAEIMAGYFVRDMRSMPDTAWTADTIVANTTTMYAPNGEVSAYTFELQTNGTDTGYIVVSAYPDVENKILEFSDETAPIYDNLNLSTNDTVVYSGNLNYFKATKNSNLLTTIDGITINKESAPTPLQELRNTSYLPTQTRISYPITDPIDWANKYYGGPYEAVEWKNPFENNCKFRRADTYASYKQHCVPVAITNLIEIVGDYRNYSNVTSKSGTMGLGIFGPVVKLGLDKGYYENSSSGGTDGSFVSTYIKESFSLFKISTSITTYDSITYSRVKNAIDAYKPICILLNDHTYYGRHAVTGYAYTYLQNQSNSTYRGFVKIADGLESSGRYLPTANLVYDTMHVITIGSLG